MTIGIFSTAWTRLSALGKPVLISNFLRYHRLVTYLSRQTDRPIALPIGLVRLRDVLDEKFYTDLPGGLMESLGQLFKNGAKLYVYPSRDKKTGQLTTVENLEVAPNLRHLYAHLVENKFIENIANYNADALKIYSGEVLAKIHSGDESLEPDHPARRFLKSSRPKNCLAGSKRWPGRSDDGNACGTRWKFAAFITRLLGLKLARQIVGCRQAWQFL